MKLLQPDELTIENLSTQEEEVISWNFPDARVLVVDDGPENRELVRFLLEDAGIAVDEAENGKIGLDKAIAEDYDVILMDVQMPVMDGFEAAGKMRQHGLDTPIVALTANAMNGFAEECYAVGYSDFFSKPIDVDKFMDKMVELLGGSATSQKLEPVATNIEPEKPAGSTSSQANEDVPIVSALGTSNPRFAHLIERFVVTLAEKLELMNKAHGNQAYSELADLAHWLKGAGGTIGFDQFTEPAAKLEITAKASDGSAAREHLDRIHSLEKRVRAGVQSSSNSTTQEPPAVTSASVPDRQTSVHDQDGEQSAALWDRDITSRLAGNARFAGPLSSFKNRLAEKLAELEDELSHEHLSDFKNFSHWLKGSAGTVGYDAFTEPATALDNYLLEGDINNARPLLAQIRVMQSFVVAPEEKTAEALSE